MNRISRNITLCGIKHAGKTSAAKALAALTGSPFADTDDVLRECYAAETGTPLSVREIYRQLGEPDFRALEIRALRTLFRKDSGTVIALGGGVLSNPFFTESDRREMGFLCCLDTPDRIAFDRILSNGLPPFLQDKENPFAEFCAMNSARRSVFREKADLIVEPEPESTPEKTADIIFSSFQIWRTNHE